VLSPTPAQLEAAREAQRGEALRLFYVAVTRARHALWMGVSDHPRPKSKSGTWPLSALGHLLSRSDVASVGCGEDPDETPQAHATLPVVEDVLAHASGYSDVCVEILGGDDKIPAIALTRLRSLEAPGPLAPPPSYRAEFDRRWAVSSYSQLVREAVSAGSPGTALGGSNDPDAGPAAARTGLDTAAGAVDGGSLPSRTLRDDEPDEQDPSLAAAQPEGRDEGSRPSGGEAQAPWHRFPRGAFAGDFLHTQLEWLASEHFQLEASPDLQQRLVRRCERQGWGARADDVVAWLREVCHRPLPPLGVPLAGLQTVAPEMEFWFPSDGLSGERLDQLCRQALWPGVARAALTPRTLRGLMMGFADLVFEHEGRYWVLDYKSNRLGPRDGDYTHEAMAAAMRDHRYDVQAALYLLALHRLLRSRLGARYAPGQHLGGALYLFLRGIRGPAAGCVAWESPVALVEALDALIPARVLPEEGSLT
jgi:exodeoxyribonuclease V beta subunit